MERTGCYTHTSQFWGSVADTCCQQHLRDPNVLNRYWNLYHLLVMYGKLSSTSQPLQRLPLITRSRNTHALFFSSLNIVLLSLQRSIYLFSFRSKEPKFQSISKLTRSKNNWLETQQDRKLSKIPLISTLQFNKRKDFTNEESVSIFRSKKK